MPTSGNVPDDMRDTNLLTCGECGSVYRYSRNGRMRGPGSFECRVCGQDIFAWVCAENYDFDLMETGTWQNAPDVPNE